MARLFSPAAQALLPRLEARVLPFARRFPGLETDDAMQEARYAFWRVTERHPELEGSELYRMAIVRMKGAVTDYVRNKLVEGGRRYGEQAEYQDDVYRGDLNGARAIGLLHQLAPDAIGKGVYELVAVCPRPSPEQALLSRLEIKARGRYLRRRLRLLEPRRRLAVCLTLLNVPQTEIATLLGVTAPRISQFVREFVTGKSGHAIKQQRRALKALRAAA